MISGAKEHQETFGEFRNNKKVSLKECLITAIFGNSENSKKAIQKRLEGPVDG